MFLITDGIGLKNNVVNPAPSWFHDRSWNEICLLDELNAYRGKMDFNL